jgi:hypothetical protein
MKQSPVKYWLAFTAEWFERHQGALLWLANNRWLGGAFRRRINLRPDMRVVSITPDAINYASDGAECVLIAYPGPVVAMDVYRAFRPLWWAIHYWDELFADRWAPELSYGFDTLTGNTQTSGQYFDGVILSNAPGLAAAGTASSGATVVFPTDNAILQLDASQKNVNTVNREYFFSRLFFKFNLSSVTGSFAVSNAVFSIGLRGYFNRTGSIYIREATIADSNTTLSNTPDGNNIRDWQKINPTTYVDYNSLSAPLYDEFNQLTTNFQFTSEQFNGLNFISSKMGGALKLAMQSQRDGQSVISEWYMSFWAVEHTSAAARPKITITYTRAIYPTGIASTATFGTPTASAGAPAMQPTGRASTVTFGTFTIANVILAMQPTGIASTVTFGTFRNATIRLTGLANVNAFGSPFLGLMSPTGLASTVTFGTFTIAKQGAGIVPTGIASTNAFGLFSTTSPFPISVYIARLIDEPIEYGYEVYQFEDGSADVNVQPCGARRWTLEYEGLSAVEIRQLISHYNLMRGSSGAFNFYHRRDAVTYSGVRYVSMRIPQRQRAWNNAASIVLEKLQ